MLVCRLIPFATTQLCEPQNLNSTRKAPGHTWDYQTPPGKRSSCFWHSSAVLARTRPGSCNGEKPTFYSESPNPPWELGTQATDTGRARGMGIRKLCQHTHAEGTVPVLPHHLNYNLETLWFWCRSLQENTTPKQSVCQAPRLDCESQEGPLAEQSLAQCLLPNRSPRTCDFQCSRGHAKGAGKARIVFRTCPLEATYLKDRSFSP